MNNAKSTVKTVLGFVLVIILILGTLFGIEIPYDEDDIASMGTDITTSAVTAEVTTNEVEQTKPSDITTAVPQVTTSVPNEPTEEVPSNTTEDTAEDVEVPVEDTEDATQDSTPTDAETDKTVDNSEDGDVATTPEEEQDATEGDVQDA